MGFSKAEKSFIGELANMHTDVWIRDEINRIRGEGGVSSRAVRRERERQGIKKYRGGKEGKIR